MCCVCVCQCVCVCVCHVCVCVMCVCVCVCDILAVRSYLNLDVYTKTKAQCHEFCCVARPVHVCAVIEGL